MPSQVPPFWQLTAAAVVVGVVLTVAVGDLVGTVGVDTVELGLVAVLGFDLVVVVVTTAGATGVEEAEVVGGLLE